MLTRGGDTHDVTTSPRLSEHKYLKKVESLANVVVEAALDEGWLSDLPEAETATPLQRAVNELARNLRHVHYEGDGCLKE